MSKNIRLPARVQLIDIDNATGSYPTVLRTGDPDRKGNVPVFFDDTKSIVFNSSMIDLPTGLPVASMFIDSNNRLTVSGTVRKGVADEYVTFKHNVEKLKPFDESSLFEQTYRGQSFFETGSKYSDVGFGFTNSLGSKTIVEFDISPVTSYELTYEFSTTTPSYPMAYFNFQKKAWEGIGLGTPMRSLIRNHFDTVTLGIGASSGIPVPTNDLTIPLRGLPISNYGFPAHAKFHATSSQTLSMSSTLNHPFLVEKILYEFSGSFDWAAGSVGSFMILNQRSPAILNSSVTTENATIAGSDVILTMSLPTTLQLSSGGQQTYVDDIRDIVSFATVGIASDDSLSVDLLLPNSPVVASPQATGSFILSSSIKSPSINRVGVFKVAAPAPDSTQVFILDNLFGSRNGMGLNTGRDLRASVSGLIPTGSIPVTDGLNPTIKPNKVPYIANPYIIFPNDRLIFAWHVAYPYSTGRSAMSLLPGKGKIRLYGSLVSNAQEYHDTRNQCLTTNAVHEFIGNDHVIDQYLTEPLYMYSGSYVGDWVTGSMSQNRRIITTTVASGSLSFDSTQFIDNETKSIIRGFNRFCKHVSSEERYYDTVLPRIDSIITALGGKIYNMGNAAMIVLGHSSSLGFGDIAEQTWNRAFPFEPKFSSVSRMTSTRVTAVANYNYSGAAVPALELPVRLARVSEQSADGAYYLYETRGNYAKGDQVILADFYGIGNFLTGSPQPTAYVDDTGYGRPKPRGFKYGILNAFPQNTDAVWRCDRFGQFRDLLEQRQDSKMLIDVDAGTPRPGSSVVNVKFVEKNSVIVTRSMYTTSSNLSLEASSSLPYFDGTVRNRYS